MIRELFPLAQSDIGIDLGTANTLVYVSGRGIVINEPSVIAINQKTGHVVAVGSEAKRMVGRTPSHIIATRPLVDGVISDFEITEEMLRYFIKRALGNRAHFWTRPRVVIGIPSGITEVERRAVKDAAISAGAREAFLVEEPMAAAIGVRLEIQEPMGNMIVDIGGGTSDIAVVSLGGIVASKNLRVAGDRLSGDIIQYARDEFKLLLGERTAEDLKIAIGSVLPQETGLEATMRGRDLVTGLPREVLVTDSDIREAMRSSITTLIKSIRETIELTPPELVADIIHRGIVLVGGGSLLRGLETIIERETRIPVRVAEDPLTAVVRGTGIILEDIDNLRDILLESEHETEIT